MDNAAKKEFGQHWLNDKTVLREINVLARINPNDTVLEIGPGLGSLTELLLEGSKKVIAVELDRDLISQLEQRFSDNDKLEIINQDIRNFDFRTLPNKYKVVANIPYYLTSYLIRMLSMSVNPPRLCVLLVQKEVAERIAAKPGELSILGITTQVYWEITLGPIVPAELFTPPPKIDSQVICLERRRIPLIPEDMEKSFFRLVRIGFSQKRKTLLNCLSGGLHLEKEKVKEYLDQVGIDYNTRPQELSLNEWQDLTIAIFNLSV